MGYEEHGKDIGQRVQTSSYKMNKFWGSNVQHANYSLQYCIKYLKVAKRVSPKYSHYKTIKL